MDTIHDKNSLPDTAPWDALAAEFRAGAPESAALPLTVRAGEPCPPDGGVGPLRRFVRRTLRRALRWYIDPLVAGQNRANRALLGEIEALRRRVAELEGKERP